ncbi:MAG TPA: DUF2510 domain-containing protein [Pseudolysinimonas sp.]|nr:DUF2510 domain-containing protein [Pseudolysinimonas sp.]
MSDPNALPIAGWYPDPENAAGERWWNGSGWSDHRRPATAPVPGPAPATAPPAYVPAPIGPRNTMATLGFVFALGGIIINLAGLTALAGAILSIIGLRRARELRAQGVSPDGHGMALAGVIVGFAWFAISLAGTIIGIMWIVYLSSHGGSYLGSSYDPAV